jgi:uncharacterized Ntn-hydrolase superfamily protein
MKGMPHSPFLAGSSQRCAPERRRAVTKRGKQSAALVICGDEEWPDLNLRVDDHADPLAELERLEKVSRERFVHFRRFLPSRRDRVGVTDRALIESEIAKAIAAGDSS